MRRRRVWRSLTVLAALAVPATSCSSAGDAGTSPSAATTTTSPADPRFAPGRRRVTFDVDGVARTALVAVPRDDGGPAPLVFVFHGHGGSGAGIAARDGIDRLWPGAIVVYPDGLVGHKGMTDPGGVRPGWQTRPGEAGDRDVELFDVALATIGDHLEVDPDRIYLVGHSNGAGFVSLLLATRGDVVAAVATSSAQPGARVLAAAPARPMFMSMGTHDPIVAFEVQQASIPLAERKLAIDPATTTVTGNLRTSTGPGGLELAVYVHPGGHEMPPEVPGLVVDFFRRHALRAVG